VTDETRPETRDPAYYLDEGGRLVPIEAGLPPKPIMVNAALIDTSPPMLSPPPSSPGRALGASAKDRAARGEGWAEPQHRPGLVHTLRSALQAAARKLGQMLGRPLPVRREAFPMTAVEMARLAAAGRLIVAGAIVPPVPFPVRRAEISAIVGPWPETETTARSGQPSASASDPSHRKGQPRFREEGSPSHPQTDEAPAAVPGRGERAGEDR